VFAESEPIPLSSEDRTTAQGVFDRWDSRLMHTSSP